MTFSCYTITHLQVFYATAHIHNLAHILVPNGHGGSDGLPGPVVPLINMQVSSANRCFFYFDQDIIHTDGRNGNLFHPDAFLRPKFHQCFHILSFMRSAVIFQLYVLKDEAYSKFGC